MKNKLVFQRLFWSCIYITIISCTIYMVVTLWSEFMIHPTVTTMVSSTYPVNQIPFPSVAVCNVNKISKKRALDLSANKTKNDPGKIMDYLRFIGKLYDFDFESSILTQLLEFQNLLDAMDMNVTHLTDQLAVPCDELLRNCYWRNVEVNCSDIFVKRLTHHGHCCIFNYVKKTMELIEKVDETPITTDAGVENGLYISVNNDMQDYFYPTLSSTGVMVYIFVPTEYPDKSSGGLTEIVTQPNSENFIEIVPTTLIATKDVADYPVETRGCLFQYEQETSFFGPYSESDCHLHCRIISIEALCQCTPFQIPTGVSNSVCTLADIPCLNRYKDKWFSLYPDGDNGPFLRKEKQDSLRCEINCHSSCEEIFYEAFANSFPIFNKTESRLNITRIYIYYLQRFSKLYQQDVVYYWFDVLSNFGGIFGIFVGWSLISMLQFLYYYLKLLLKTFSEKKIR